MVACGAEIMDLNLQRLLYVVKARSRWVQGLDY